MKRIIAGLVERQRKAGSLADVECRTGVTSSIRVHIAGSIGISSTMNRQAETRVAASKVVAWPGVKQ